MAKGSSNDNDMLGLGLIVAGVVVVASAAYLATRAEVNELRRRIDALEIKVQRGHDHLEAFSNYVAEQDRRITTKEGNIDAINADLVDIREQLRTKLNDSDVERILTALIQKAMQSKVQTINKTPIAAYS